MRKIVTLIIYCLLAFLSLGVAQTGYFIPSERFSGGTVSDICQDKYGFVWIATDNGLNRFDGYNFTTYNHSYEDSLSINSNIVTQLLCDRDGNLWVGTRLGLARFDYVEEHLVRYRVEPSHTRILSFLQLHNDTLLVGSSGHGLYKLEGDHLEKMEGMTSYGGNFYFNQMTEDSKGRFWKVGYGKEITVAKPAEPTHHFCQAGYDEATGELVIKVVNATDQPYRRGFSIAGAATVIPTGKVITLSGNAQDENTFEQPTKLAPQTSIYGKFGRQFTYEFAPMSFTILRVKASK